MGPYNIPFKEFICGIDVTFDWQFEYCKRFASPASPIVDLFVRNCAIFATDVFACQLSALLLKTLVEKMQCWGNSPPISSDLVESVELYTTL